MMENISGIIEHNVTLSLRVLSHIDFANRVISMIIFALYFVAIVVTKDLRTKKLLYVHHTNFIGFLLCLMYIFYTNETNPTLFSDPRFNQLLCSVSEFAWSMLKYLRPYSVLLIAIYRFIAVFSNGTFKRINNSAFYLALPIIIAWTVSLGLFLGTKFLFKTTHGYIFCMDGYNKEFRNVLGYLIVSSALSFFIPLILVLTLYLQIRRKINNSDVLRPKKKNGPN
jgi:hypothetical protein